MGSWIVVYSIANNKPWQSAGWMTAAEKDTLEDARRVYDNFVEKMDEDTASDPMIRGKITQVAIFRVRGKETFTGKPRFYADRRDKTDWPMPAVTANLVNQINSDFSINWQK